MNGEWTAFQHFSETQLDFFHHTERSSWTQRSGYGGFDEQNFLQKPTREEVGREFDGRKRSPQEVFCPSFWYSNVVLVCHERERVCGDGDSRTSEAFWT